MHYHARQTEPSITHKRNQQLGNSITNGRQLIVASNRQPYRHGSNDTGQVTIDRPTGGLTAGLDPVMQQIGGTWIAWGDGDRDFDVTDDNGCIQVPPNDPSYQLQRIPLSQDQKDGYYYGFSNQVLWPICHSAITKVRCQHGFWQQYRDVNEQFARVIADAGTPNTIVWFHDYHLALAPKRVRHLLSDNAILIHFWHIPWPPWDTFRACPHRRTLLQGLLANDVVGFHIPRYGTNFLRCVTASLPEATVDWRHRTVSYNGRKTTINAIPMGVPYEEIRRNIPNGLTSWASFTQKYGIQEGRQIAIGVERLDYTKGITERLLALERFWERYPRWRGEITYVQKATASRSEIPAYQKEQARVKNTIDRINDRFGTDDWTPIVFISDHLAREELYRLYRQADVALVTPIRDGMNLVAQEFIAAQTLDDSGVLVLGHQAGIHDEVGEFAVSVTPFDREGFAEAIADALTLSPRDRQYRMQNLQQWVKEHDLAAWSEANLRAALEASPRQVPRIDRSTPMT